MYRKIQESELTEIISMYRKIQASGLTEIIPLICTSAIGASILCFHVLNFLKAYLWV